MQITLTGDAKRDAALLHKARKRQLAYPIVRMIRR